MHNPTHAGGQMRLCWDGLDIRRMTHANYPSSQLNSFPRQGPVNHPVTSPEALGVRVGVFAFPLPRW